MPPSMREGDHRRWWRELVCENCGLPARRTKRGARVNDQRVDQVGVHLEKRLLLGGERIAFTVDGERLLDRIILLCYTFCRGNLRPIETTVLSEVFGRSCLCFLSSFSCRL